MHVCMQYGNNGIIGEICHQLLGHMEPAQTLETAL
jgi:hypothetical protein